MMMMMLMICFPYDCAISFKAAVSGEEVVIAQVDVRVSSLALLEGNIDSGIVYNHYQDIYIYIYISLIRYSYK